MENFFDNKSVLLIGGTGSIGTVLVEKILKCKPKVIRIYSRDEYKQFLMKQKFEKTKDMRYLIGDIRDKERLQRAMKNIDIVINLAALKHVPSCEYNPFEAIKTNVLGTQNMIEAAIDEKVDRVLYTSTDKAISPTNTMGATKLLAERLISSANYFKGGEKPIFSAVRFGNVMGSRGSVIPLFKEQILKERCITITEPTMSRFMMTITQAVELILKCLYCAEGGEIFVLKMPVVQLGVLAEVVVEEVCKKYNIDRKEVKIKTIGLRQGEKMYEELMTADEAIHAEDLNGVFRIHDSRSKIEYKQTQAYNTDSLNQTYNTNSLKIEFIDKEKIRKMIVAENIL